MKSKSEQKSTLCELVKEILHKNICAILPDLIKLVISETNEIMEGTINKIK